MTTTDYTEAYDHILDWKESLGRDFTADEQAVAAEAQAQITAYTGRFYGEIRHDIARCAVASLRVMNSEEIDNVTPLRSSKADVYKSTRYVATATRIDQ